jgi:Tol biopolymer transport system component
VVLSAGTRLGDYEIHDAVGAGGMGEVYRARDTKLNRDVALKVLPDAFVLDVERLARFRREAQVLALLNHTNIAAIYGFQEANGIKALVLEFVDGPTLGERIAGGPIAIDEALSIARQIAEALEAAHEQGIVHRDLKPANIKLRSDGTVKVLDFGLAKAVAGSSEHDPSHAVTQSPTITTPAMTQMGVILGTAAYMSPEQAKGRPADKRGDIWAFGCVLYEMLTGARLLQGEDITETIAAVVRATPDWGKLPPGTPESIRRLLRRCLEKDRKERLPHIGAARLEVKDALASMDVEMPPVMTTVVRSRRGERLAWVLAGITTMAALALGAKWYSSRALDARTYRSMIVPPAHLQGDPAGRLAISPDGRRLAFLAPDATGRVIVWVRPLDSLSAQPLAGTEDAAHPFWSPDSRFIAFTASGKLKRIDASGGPALTLCESGSIGYGTWNRDDVILFASTNSTGIHRVSAGGGPATPVTALDSNAGETGHRFPFFLPDGRHFLFVAYAGNIPRAIHVGSLDGSVRSLLMEGGSNAAYSQGFLLFARDGTLMAQPFDANRLALTGDPSPVAERVLTQPARASTFSVAQTGELVYVAGESGRQLQWVDRDGKLVRTLGERRTGYSDVHVSTDGRRAAVSINPENGNASDIWIVDVQRGASMQLTSDPAIENGATWSPDDTRIVFQSNQNKINFDLYERASSGAGGDALLFSDGQPKNPTSWSPDGKHLLYTTGGASGNRDIWVLSMDGTREARPFRDTPFNEGEAEFSPDGQWVAFASDESGESQVYVAPFPGPGGKWPISTTFGRLPRWRRDGKELFFEARGGVLMSAAVSGEKGVFDVGPVRTLLGGVSGGGSARRRWDAAPDGQHFLVTLENSNDEIVPITLVVNWMAALKK